MSDWICEQIEAGKELPGIFYKSDHYLAFLDPKPLAEGHGLLVPRRHVVTIKDLTAEERAQFGIAYLAVSDAYRKEWGDSFHWVKDGPDAGQNLPHIHWHFYPRNKEDVTWADDGRSRLALDTQNNLGIKRLEPTSEALEAVAARLRAHLPDYRA
jgi:histidine triad (HIT) family protein